jgi:hypothetical protein
MVPLATPTHHEIVLKYNLLSQTMQLSDNGVDCPDRTFHLKVGDVLEFSSPNGAVDVELEPPEVFSPNAFAGGQTPSAPVVVKAAPGAGVTCKLWCGIQGIVKASDHITAYGGFPEIP